MGCVEFDSALMSGAGVLSESVHVGEIIPQSHEDVTVLPF